MDPQTIFGLFAGLRPVFFIVLNEVPSIHSITKWNKTVCSQKYSRTDGWPPKLKNLVQKDQNQLKVKILKTGPKNVLLLSTILFHELFYTDSSPVLVILASEHLLEAYLSFLVKFFCHPFCVVENC